VDVFTLAELELRPDIAPFDDLFEKHDADAALGGAIEEPGGGSPRRPGLNCHPQTMSHGKRQFALSPRKTTLEKPVHSRVSSYGYVPPSSLARANPAS
jgi:hypothetical protein